MLAITTMTRPELDLAMEWAAAEGWNPGLSDADAFFAADPGGFLLGRVDGEPVAMISAVRWGADFGFVGFFIVRPDRRGQGYGLEIWRAGMERLAGRIVGLDGVVAQQDNYRKSGFVLAHRNIRCEARALGGAAPGVLPLAALPEAELLRYDQPFFPVDRRAFLKRWITLPGVVALGVPDGAGGWGGYAVMRPCRVGHKIGPLYADRPADAAALLGALLAAAPAGEPVYLDLPERNPGALALAREHNLAPVFETARMYIGPEPDIAMARTYGITTFELG